MPTAIYHISEISSIVGGKLISGKEESTVSHLLIDSRKIIAPDNSVFFAIKGERHDGHRYLDELYIKGVRNFVVSDMPANMDGFEHAAFVKVDDTMLALQSLAAHHRSRYHIPVIGITGSNGKTIVKEWLYQLLSEDKNTVRSPRSYNSQVGVPLSVWQMNEEHELALFEAGISMPGEMKKLQPIINPVMGLFTNIGEAHSENFKGLDEKINEKMKLFEGVEVLFYCKDDKKISEKHIPSFTWAKERSADLKVEQISKKDGCTNIEATFKNDKTAIKIPFTDDASVENAIHCWAVMLYLGYEKETISQRMAVLSPVAMRLDLNAGINHCTIINDSYNSDIGSLSVAVDFLNQQNQHPQKTIILSDILQSGRDEKDLYAEIAAQLNKNGIGRIIGIGEAICRQQHQFDIAEKVFYKSTPDFLEEFAASGFSNEAVLLKGARQFGFEKIGKLLEQKTHATVLEIDLNAIVHNLNYYRSKLEPGTKIMAMVKAFSYGSGSYEIANLLQYHRADYLCVAYADEGVELRKAGITLPLMVMNPEMRSYELLLKHHLEPELYSMNGLQSFTETLKKNLFAENLPFPVHIKLDTGMHRLGFEEKEIAALSGFLKGNKYIEVKSIFSHLAASDEPAHKQFTEEQIVRFERMSNAITVELDYPVMRHILNSAGVESFPEAQFDMVRIGIGLYGVGAEKLQEVSALRTSIAQIKQVKKGETVGYGRNGKAEKDMNTATVSIGYADGLSRMLGNGKGKMLVSGKFAPIIGNVCMDMCMLDITGIPAKEGDEVTVFGKGYPITEYAADMGTIPYEVLTGVSRRVKRVYYQE